MHGLGTFTWPDGRKYIGEYVNSVKEGKGQFLKPDGSLYEGIFVNGKLDGMGTVSKLKKGAVIKL
jgi:hypothetical protein